jgi:hypothetical protein
MQIGNTDRSPMRAKKMIFYKKALILSKNNGKLVIGAHQRLGRNWQYHYHDI